MQNPCNNCKRKPNCPKVCYPKRDYQKAQKRNNAKKARTNMRNYIFRGRRIHDGKWVVGCLLRRGNYCAILEDNDDDIFMDAETGVIDGNLTPVVPETVELLEERRG